MSDSPKIPDYSGEEKEPTIDELRQLGQLAAQQGLLELQIEDTEEKLKELKKEHAHYAEKLLPELLARIGLKSVTTRGGLTVEYHEDVRASLPQDPVKREAAFNYVRESGNDGIIKREITIRYGRDDSHFADQLLAALDDMGVKDHATVDHEWSIHNKTLVTYIREELKEGKNIPLEAFGAFVQKHAKIRRRA